MYGKKKNMREAQDNLYLWQNHELSEEDVKLRYITPALEAAGENRCSQIRINITLRFTNDCIITQETAINKVKPKLTKYHISNYK